MRKVITAAQRRQQDHLRQVGVQTAKNYARLLVSLRSKEVGRIIKILKEQYPPKQWPLVAPVLLEEAYLEGWYKGCIVTSGLPAVGPTARALVGSAEAVGELAGVFEKQLGVYAINRAGAEITTVTGTMKETLQDILGRAISEDVNIGVEKLAQRLAAEFDEKNVWMARRIAQTEMMNGLAEAGRETADALAVPYLKTWCVSGLGNTRETHLALDGVTIEADDTFQLLDCTMRYPHDTESNPPAEEIINCACSCIRTPK